MTDKYNDNRWFPMFFESFSQAGIEGIDPGDLLVELYRLMEMNNQLCYITDAILLVFSD